MRKFVPKNEAEVLKWDFLTVKAISSDMYTNPMQSMMTAIKEGLQDVRTGVSIFVSFIWICVILKYNAKVWYKYLI